ncbi:MAG TPA: hypothetical protein VKY65_06910 [Alphaproteobacteria bacterium]|nr:hypothetical protein [Alphaproteobacteria bacterium]
MLRFVAWTQRLLARAGGWRRAAGTRETERRAPEAGSGHPVAVTRIRGTSWDLAPYLAAAGMPESRGRFYETRSPVGVARYIALQPPRKPPPEAVHDNVVPFRRSA